jgi:hypothetical protein
MLVEAVGAIILVGWRAIMVSWPVVWLVTVTGRGT